jgi:hypothetical protein
LLLLEVVRWSHASRQKAATFIIRAQGRSGQQRNALVSKNSTHVNALGATTCRLIPGAVADLKKIAKLK